MVLGGSFEKQSSSFRAPRLKRKLVPVKERRCDSCHIRQCSKGRHLLECLINRDRSRLTIFLLWRDENRREDVAAAVSDALDHDGQRGRGGVGIVEERQSKVASVLGRTSACARVHLVLPKSLEGSVAEHRHERSRSRASRQRSCGRRRMEAGKLRLDDWVRDVKQACGVLGPAYVIRSSQADDSGRRQSKWLK